MEYVSFNDLYEIRLASLVSNVDKDVLVELYQPLVGASATMLYITLLKQVRNNKETETYKMESLLKVSQFAPGVVLSARHMLEAVGLLRTYEKKLDTNSRSYIYVLYAPKSPKDFFDDVLFKGLLIQSIGEKEANRLADKYKINLSIPSEFKEVSASFKDVYHPDYDDESFLKEINSPLVGHDSGKVNTSFSFDSFFKYLEEESQLLPSSLTKKDLKEIERLSTLFGIDEKKMASIIIEEYDPHTTPHLNYENIIYKSQESIKYKTNRRVNKNVAISEVNGDSVISSKIRMMDEVNPTFFLRMLQNNTKPALSDLKIIDSLSSNYGFNNGVINAIIDYTLTKNNNILSKNYCEKIASSLAREKIETAIDAMNYLNRININSKKENSSINKQIKGIKEVSKTKKQDKEEISDEEIEDLINMIETKKKGGNR